jgi:dienelactone hydrolase
MHQIPKAVLVEPVPFASRTAVYEAVTIDMEDCQIKARTIRPAREGKHPLVLMFHDLNREIRGWHHMTRFIALGYGVVALEASVYREDWKPNPEAVGFEGYIRDALVLAEYARKLDWADAGQIATWGEGLGSGIMIETGDGSLMEIFADAEERLPQGAVRHFALRADDVDAAVSAVREAGYEITMEPEDIVIDSAVPFPARIAFAKGIPCRSTARESLRAMRVIFVALDSAETGKMTPIPENMKDM